MAPCFPKNQLAHTLGLVLVLVLVLAAPGSVGLADGQPAPQTKATPLHHRIPLEAAAQLPLESEQQQNIHTALNHLAMRIGVSHRRKRNLEARIKRTQKRVRDIKYAFLHLEARHQRTKQALNKSVLKLYRLSKQSLGGAFFSFINSPTFLKHGRYAAIAHQKQFALLNNYAKRRKFIVRASFRRRDALNALQELESALQGERKHLFDQTGHLRTLLADLHGNADLRQSRNKRLQAQAQKVKIQLQTLEQITPTHAKKARKNPPSAWRHPVENAKLVRAFGNHTSYNQEEPLAGGVLIRSDSPSVAKAANSGVVVLVGPFYGQGSMVVVHHENHLFSVYGHLESLLVKPGQRVNVGDSLGEIAYQPLHQAYWLYFGLRQQGISQNPFTLLPPIPAASATSTASATASSKK